MARPKGIPSHLKGKKLSDEHKRKLSLAKKGKQPWLGLKHSEESKLKMRISRKKYLSDNKPWNYIEDRTKIAKRQERNDTAYKDWRISVYKRDSFKCKINNKDCDGRIEAHHILGWSEYPELRYMSNNGITLCHAHHPKKRAEEKRLIQTFTELVSVSKV